MSAAVKKSANLRAVTDHLTPTPSRAPRASGSGFPVDKAWTREQTPPHATGICSATVLGGAHRCVPAGSGDCDVGGERDPMAGASVIGGPGYTAAVPPGFMVFPVNPMTGAYALLPPGSTPPPASPASIEIKSVPPIAIQPLLTTLNGLMNPFLGMMNAQSLGLASVVLIAPARQALLNYGMAHIREFEAIGAFSGQPVRIMLVLLLGQVGTVQVVLGINLFRWAEFLAPCLEFDLRYQRSGQCSADLRTGAGRRGPGQQESDRVPDREPRQHRHSLHGHAGDGRPTDRHQHRPLHSNREHQRDRNRRGRAQHRHCQLGGCHVGPQHQDR